MEEQLKGMAERFGFYANRCEVELSEKADSFGQVTMVRLTVRDRRPDGNMGGSDQRGVVKEVEEIEEVRISPIQRETRISGADANQSAAGSGQPEIESLRPETDSAQSETESAWPETAGNQDTLKLAEQIAQLYQLGPERVTVNLVE